MALHNHSKSERMAILDDAISSAQSGGPPPLPAEGPVGIPSPDDLQAIACQVCGSNIDPATGAPVG